jgi:hypothetical protein
MARTLVTKKTEITIGERKFVLTPLTLAELQQVQEGTKVLTDPNTSWIDYVNQTAPMIQASMSRAGAAGEDPRVLLDLESWQVVWNALLEISGLKAVTPGEAKPATA